jgi:hypothetical protein
VDLSIDLRDPFPLARDTLETTIPIAVYGYFHGCIFLAPAGEITGRIERQLPKLGFGVRDREPRKSRGGHLYTPGGAQISISTPSIEAIIFLANISAIKPYSVEIALDITSDSELAARKLHWAIEQCIVQPWAGNRNICNYMGTTYTGQRQPGPHDHLAIYSDEPSRATGELNCVHIEWRYQGRKRLLKIGVESPATCQPSILPSTGGHTCRSSISTSNGTDDGYRTRTQGREGKNQQLRRRRRHIAITSISKTDLSLILHTRSIPAENNDPSNSSFRPRAGGRT